MQLRPVPQPVPPEEREEEECCAVCISAARTHVCVPCGHRCLCGACAELLSVSKRCPMCRAELIMIMRVHE